MFPTRLACIGRPGVCQASRRLAFGLRYSRRA